MKTYEENKQSCKTRDVANENKKSKIVKTMTIHILTPKWESSSRGRYWQNLRYFNFQYIETDVSMKRYAIF